jgi:hypothetical protein
MNFYHSAVDEQLRLPDDGLSIGIILCKSRNELIVEYALRDTAKPMGVSQYRLSTALPDQFQSELPTLEEFARELPYLPLVAVRIEIERALRLLMTSRGLEPGRGVGIGRALCELKESGEVPSGTEAFVRTLATMNEAVHGIEVGTRGSGRGTASSVRVLGRTPSPRGGIGDYDRLCPTSNITKRSQMRLNKLGSNK